MDLVHYETIKIPEGLANMIDEIVEESKGFFTSRPDFIKYVTREYIRDNNDMKKWKDEHDRKKRLSVARVDGGNSTIGGEGLARSEASSEGGNKESSPDAGSEQPSIMPGGEGAADNMVTHDGSGTTETPGK